MLWRLQRIFSKFRKLFRGWFWRNATVSLSEVILWSVLAKIGRTTPMRLTAIIPLLGVVLLFNETTSRTLTLAPEFLQDIGRATEGDFSLSTLYFTYFGLCALGLGSIVFSFRCPSDIQTQPNQLDYVASTPIGDSKNLAKSYLRYVVQAFASANNYGYAGNASFRERLSYPSSLIGEMHGLLEELYGAANFHDEHESDDSNVSSNETENIHEEMPDFMEVMNAAGYLDFTKFGIAMANEIRLNWAYTMPFYDEAPNFSRDIAYLKFRTDDFSRFASRFVTAALYGIGFFLLSIPTAQTFYLLFKNAVSHIF